MENNTNDDNKFEPNLNNVDYIWGSDQDDLVEEIAASEKSDDEINEKHSRSQ